MCYVTYHHAELSHLQAQGLGKIEVSLALPHVQSLTVPMKKTFSVNLTANLLKPAWRCSLDTKWWDLAEHGDSKNYFKGEASRSFCLFRFLLFHFSSVIEAIFRFYLTYANIYRQPRRLLCSLIMPRVYQCMMMNERNACWNVRICAVWAGMAGTVWGHLLNVCAQPIV